jgi:hypothetical protein
MRAGVVAQRQLQHVLEEHGSHHLVLAVGEAVGVERHQGAADDAEQREAHPDADQQHQILPVQLRRPALGVRQQVDDASEQPRLGEHGGGDRQIGAGEHPAQTGLAPEHFKHADVEAKEFHEADIGRGKRRFVPGGPVPMPGKSTLTQRRATCSR